jgi:hypothetical protein
MKEIKAVGNQLQRAKKKRIEGKDHGSRESLVTKIDNHGGDSPPHLYYRPIEYLSSV